MRKNVIKKFLLILGHSQWIQVPLAKGTEAGLLDIYEVILAMMI